MDEPKKPVQQDGESLVVTPLTEIKSANVWWLWEQKIPWAMLTMFVGLPGTGKSSALCDIVARYTTGSMMPGASPLAGDEGEHVGSRFKGEAALLIGEEDVSSATKPRLIAAGADVSKVHIIECIGITYKSKKAERMFAFDRDMRLLDKMFAEHPTISFLGIDPVTTYLGMGKKSDSGDDIRGILTPLVTMCAERGVTVVFVHHFNKTATQSAIHRASGSQAWSAIARSMWMFSSPGEDEDAYTMSFVKGNYAKDKSGLHYRIESADIVDGEVKAETSRIAWLGAATNTADDILRNAADGGNRVDKAVPWLKNYVTRPMSSNEVVDAGKKAGHSKSALFEAKKVINMKAKKAKDGWLWVPVTPPEQLATEGEKVDDGETFPTMRKDYEPPDSAY